MHKSSFLWNFHKLHHTTQSLTASSGFRNSYYEDLALSIFSIFVVAVFEFKESYILYSEIILTTHGLFCHCNFNIRFPKYLRWIADPYFHASHHIADSKLIRSNYGVTFTFYDKIFGSYHLPEDLHFNDLGLPDKNDPIYKKNTLFRYFYLPLYNRDNKKKDHFNQ